VLKVIDAAGTAGAVVDYLDERAPGASGRAENISETIAISIQ
jgi:hypothetical protein